MRVLGNPPRGLWTILGPSTRFFAVNLRLIKGVNNLPVEHVSYRSCLRDLGIFSALPCRSVELALPPFGVPWPVCPRLPCPSSPALGRSAELLGLDPAQLTDALTQRSMSLRGEEILTPLNVQQVHVWPSKQLLKMLLDLQICGFD